MMPSSFKLCPTHFSRGDEKFCRGGEAPKTNLKTDNFEKSHFVSVDPPPVASVFKIMFVEIVI